MALQYPAPLYLIHFKCIDKTLKCNFESVFAWGYLLPHLSSNKMYLIQNLSTYIGQSSFLQ